MKLPQTWRRALLAAMCAMACAASPAAAETIEYTADPTGSNAPDDLVIDGDHVRLNSYFGAFRFNSIELESGSVELHLEMANRALATTFVETGSISGNMASSLLGGEDVFLSVSLVNAGTAVNIGEKYKDSATDLVTVAGELQRYGGIDVSIGDRTQRVMAGGWGETGSPEDTRSMRQTYLFHFDGSTLSFEKSKRFADVIAESASTRLTRYYSHDAGDMSFEIKTTVNDTTTGTLQTDGGLVIGVNCRAGEDSLHLDKSHETWYSNAQKAIDGLLNKQDNSMSWTADRDVVTLWLASDNTVEAVDPSKEARMDVGALQIRQGGSLTMSQTGLAADQIILSGSSTAGASLVARDASVETGLLQTIGSGTVGSQLEIGHGLTAGVVDFQDAATSLLLHVGSGSPSEGTLFAAGEVKNHAQSLLGASGGSNGVQLRVDDAAAASLANARLALVSIGGVTQAYDAITLQLAGNATRTLADGQWERLDAPERSGETILLYRYAGGELIFDTALRTVMNETDSTYDAVSTTTGPVQPSAIGTGIAADVELQATVTDTRAVTLGTPGGVISSVSDSAVRTDWTVEQATTISALTASPGVVSVTNLTVGDSLRLDNTRLAVQQSLQIDNNGSLSMGGQPLSVQGALTLDGSLSLAIGGATPTPATLVSVGSVTGTQAASLTGSTLGGDGHVSLAIDTSNQGSNVLGKKITLVSVGGSAQTYDQLTLDDNSILSATTGKNGPGMVNLDYKAPDGANVYLTYAFDGKVLSFGNALTYIAPPKESVTENLPGGGSKTTETSLQTDKLRQDVKEGSYDTIAVELPNAADPSSEGQPILVAQKVEVNGPLHLESTAVREITREITKDASGTVMNETITASVPATMTSLLVDADLSVSAKEEGTSGSLQVDKTTVRSGQTLTLENTQLATGLSLDVESGGTIDAKGEQTKIVIGGRKDIAGGLDKEATSEILGEIYLSDGAQLTAQKIGDGQNPQVNVSDTTIHLGVSKTDPDGEKTEGTVDGGATLLALNNVAIKGTGVVRNVTMTGGSLTAGHSPGQLTIEYLQGHDMRLSVSILGSNVHSGKENNDTTGSSGAISQFVVGQRVTITGSVFSIIWQGDNSEMSKLTEGTSFRFFDFVDGGRLDGDLTVDTATLPELADAGLAWDFSQLTTTGIARIVGLQFADPSRMANTLVSAGDVVAGFGNMLYGHAREATARGNNFWVSGLGDFADLSSRGGRSGYTYNGGGYAVGYNYISACGSTLGIAFGQEFGKHEPKLGTAHYAPGHIDQDTVMFGLYGHGVLNKAARHAVSLDGYAAYGRTDNHSHRARNDGSSTSTAQWNDDVFAVGLTASCDYRAGTATVLRPFVSLEFVYASMDSFRETDGDRYADYHKGKYSNFSGSLGMQIYRPYELQNGMALTPSLSVAYVGDMARNDGRVNATDQKGTSLRGRSVSPGRNGFQGTAALDWRINSRWGMRAAYMIETRSGAVDQDVNVGVNYTF